MAGSWESIEQITCTAMVFLGIRYVVVYYILGIQTSNANRV